MTLISAVGIFSMGASSTWGVFDMNVLKAPLGAEVGRDRRECSAPRLDHQEDVDATFAAAKAFDETTDFDKGTAGLYQRPESRAAHCGGFPKLRRSRTLKVRTSHADH
jgi:hypothetical protein